MAEPANTSIPLGLLAKMVQSLTLEQIDELPLSKLPRDLPEDWFDRLPRDKANALRLRLHEVAETEGVQRANSELVGALRRARKAQNIDWLGQFESSIQRLDALVKDWRRKAQPTAYTALDEPSGIETTNLPAEQVHECVIREVAKIDEAFHCKKIELRDLLQAQPQLKELKSADTTTQQVAAAIEEAHATLSKLQYLSARYHIFKLTIACHELDDLDRDIAKSAERMQRHNQDLVRVRSEIKRSRRLVSRMLGRVDEFERVRLQEDEERLLDALRECRISVTTDTVNRWLDSLVDIQLDSTAGRMALRRIEEAVQRFALLLERFSSNDSTPENAPLIPFCDAAGAYVERYFANKKAALAAEHEPEISRERLTAVKSQLLASLRGARGEQRKTGKR